MSGHVRVLALVGRLRSGSHNRQLAEAAVEPALEGVGVTLNEALAEVSLSDADIDTDEQRPARPMSEAWARILAMTATAADYRWFGERFPDLAEAYCFTLVHNLPPSHLLGRLGGRTESSRTGTAATVDAAFDLLGRSDNARQFIAMTTVGDWTLLIEPNGCLGVSEEKALPASAGTRWISHFVDINGRDSFLWAEDTAKRLMFEPGLPDHRWGTTPDELLDAMHHSGFQFWDETSDTAEFLATEAAFALAEHLTGVRVTPELLRDTTFVCGSTEIG